ncbi:MAG: cytochrome c3 family protein [Myxococcales bacterium]|nr:cytochrome c3 family protein [Myxococcales bacterium]
MQIFPRTLNLLPLVGALVAAGGGAATVFAFWYWASPKHQQVGYAPEQPIAFSHRLHAGELGIDCRYCHANVERSAEAMVPSTQTCMGCHAVVKADSPLLEPLRRSWQTGEPVRWVRVHKLTDTVFFDHSAHLAVGIGCESCHGRVDHMEVVRVVEPIAMQWCLQCHRDPAPALRPRDAVTRMGYVRTEADAPRIADASRLQPPQHCSGCHR